MENGGSNEKSLSSRHPKNEKEFSRGHESVNISLNRSKIAAKRSLRVPLVKTKVPLVYQSLAPTSPSNPPKSHKKEFM